MRFSPSWPKCDRSTTPWYHHYHRHSLLCACLTLTSLVALYAKQHAQYQKLAKNGQIVGSSSPVSSPAFTPLPSPSLSVDQGLSIPASPSVSLPLSPELLPVPSDKEYGLIENPAISFDEEGQLVTDASDFERSVTGTPLLGSPLISFEEGANDTEEAVTEGLSPATTSSSLSLLDLDFGPPSADGLSLMVCTRAPVVFHRDDVVANVFRGVAGAHQGLLL
jgi:hypothetical protein